MNAKNLLIVFAYEDLVRFGSLTDSSVSYVRDLVTEVEAILAESGIHAESLFRHLPIKREEINRFSIGLPAFLSAVRLRVKEALSRYDGVCYLPFLTKEYTVDEEIVRSAGAALLPYGPVWKFLSDAEDYKKMLMVRTMALNTMRRAMVHAPRKERGARKR